MHVPDFQQKARIYYIRFIIMGYNSLFFRIYLLFLHIILNPMVTGYRFFALFCLLCSAQLLLAQGERKDKTAVTYEEIYDEPYSVNKLFVHFQPLYGEVFTANVTAGFGLEANYYLKDKVDFKAHFRRTYSSAFFDLARQQAKESSDVDNEPNTFYYFELGGTYHVKDFESSSKTKMFLYKKSYAGNKWAARVPLNAEVPCKVRKIYGARLGAIAWQSAFDVNNVMEKQGFTADEFLDTEDNPITDVAGNDVRIFSNIKTTGLYVGGSLTWIRNVAVSFDKFEAGVDDLILTTYADILIAPSVKLDDIVYTERDGSGFPVATRTYDISPVEVKKFGFRAGIEGKFNRTLSWAYGGEIGYRPGLEGRMFYALLKISFPVFGTNLDYKVESFGK